MYNLAKKVKWPLIGLIVFLLIFAKSFDVETERGRIYGAVVILLLALFMTADIITNLKTGRTSGPGRTKFRRADGPISYWIMMAIYIVATATLFVAIGYTFLGIKDV